MQATRGEISITYLRLMGRFAAALQLDQAWMPSRSSDSRATLTLQRAEVWASKVPIGLERKKETQEISTGLTCSIWYMLYHGRMPHTVGLADMVAHG